MKRLLGGEDQINNLFPLRYPWARNLYKNALKNTWTPEEVNMGADKACYELQLSRDDRLMFENIFSVLTTSDMVITRNVAVSVFGHITAPEVHMILARIIFEEALHSDSYAHIIESIGLPQEEVYTKYLSVPAIKAKFELAEWWSQKIFRFESVEDFIHGLIFYHLFFEGCAFATGFAAFFSLQRRNLMTGTGSQIAYIARDELSIHVPFGLQLIRELLTEEEIHLEHAKVSELFRQGVECEDAIADACIPSVLGFNASMYKKHVRFLVDRRMRQLGLAPIYDAPCAISWLDEQLSLKKEVSFFEKRPTEYQVGGLQWTD